MEKKQNSLLNAVWVTIGVLLIILVWEITSLSYNNFNVYPDVIVTFKRLFLILGKADTYIAMFTSLGICLLTMLIAFLLALVLGTISGLCNAVDHILSPAIAIMKVIPTACVVILLIIFVKSIYSTMIVIFLVVFPILYESIVNGIHNIDKTIIMSLRLEGLYKFNSIVKVLIPQILPYIYVGIVSSLGLGMKVEIMSEIVVGSAGISGLGHLIFIAYAISSDYIELFALAILTLISFGLVDTILFLIKKYLKKYSI